MPFVPADPLGGFTAGPAIPRPEEDEAGDSLLTTAGKIAAPIGVGAGLVLAPQFTIPALIGAGAGAYYSDPDAVGAAFRTENTLGSLYSSNELQVDDLSRDPTFDPWAEIVDTPYQPYYEQFARARNRPMFEAIKSDIDRENKDRRTLASSGITGMVASMGAGMLDWPSALPGAVLGRAAKRGVSTG
jgi:hypothetical protein